ncbi:hypothetical protein FO519_001791 [Halicephalobus sp. NKZ332]|nr:hypothetical protein FO519_001791 [Halicephalobus sp. NKZ332]
MDRRRRLLELELIRKERIERMLRENGITPEDLILDSDDDVFNNQGPSTSDAHISNQNPISEAQTVDLDQSRQKIKQKRKKTLVRRGETLSESSSSPETKSRPKTRPLTGFRPRTAKKKSDGEDLEKTVESIIASVQNPTMETVDETEPPEIQKPPPLRALVFSPPESFEVEQNHPTIVVEEPSQSNSIIEEVEKRNLNDDSIDITPLTPREQLDILLDIDRSAEKTKASEDDEEPAKVVEKEEKIFTSGASIEIVEPSDESLPPTPRATSSFLQVPSEGTSGRTSSLEASSDEMERDRSALQSRLSFIVREKLHHFASDLRRRTSEVLEDITQEDNEDLSDNVSEAESSLAEIDKHASLMSLIGLKDVPDEEEESARKCIPGCIDPFSRYYLFWLGIVVLAFFYNAFCIPLRCTFPYQSDDNLIYWLIMDYFCDFIYVIDMMIIKPRLIFIRGGITIKDRKELAKHYFVSKQFKVDIACVLPFDLGYFFVGPIAALRVLRLLKIVAFWEFFDLLDSSFSNPYLIRITRTFCYMIYLIHCNACVYYMLSAWQAFGQIAYNYRGQWYLNKWVYNNQGNAYIRCFYFMAAISTSTGNNPPPTNVIEYGYMIFSWMMGVFVFALLLGQIRDIVYNANKNAEEFRSIMDKALGECKRLELPPAVVEKVRAWFIYTWEQQKTLDEKKLVDKLPLKLQTDLALSVHYNTLSKVQMFQDADRALLRELVLKLRPVIFLPGEMVCRKGDVGKEMYIVNQGILEVVSDTGDKVFATLSEGTVFGEISLLAIGGNNRRTANIRSKGYSTLFVLSKEDLNDVIKDYPEAQQSLKKKAKQMLKKDQTKVVRTKKEIHEELSKKCTVSTTIPTPKMLEAVAKLLPQGSPVAKELNSMIFMEHRPPPLKRWSTIPDDFSDASDSEFTRRLLTDKKKSKSLDGEEFPGAQ